MQKGPRLQLVGWIVCSEVENPLPILENWVKDRVG